ncbi:hypothetical protein EVAR_43601_1 [Eumeta japonica]|uniref:Uncharacterized protein n=1 Tax=Eumeta variegata TaxID=151549 RepID=A0A4C1XGT7_EUMVA|nr:hypothetical protein EVAR_43601_1 [Eumeta japonica]
MLQCSGLVCQVRYTRGSGRRALRRSLSERRLLDVLRTWHWTVTSYGRAAETQASAQQVARATRSCAKTGAPKRRASWGGSGAHPGARVQSYRREKRLFYNNNIVIGREAGPRGCGGAAGRRATVRVSRPHLRDVSISRRPPPPAARRPPPAARLP